MQTVRVTRPGGYIGYIGCAHGGESPGRQPFFCHLHIHGGHAHVCQFLSDYADRAVSQRIDPGCVFDSILLLDDAEDGYTRMGDFEAVKVRLVP
jgi:threonine dehydrogenase-like Zn-dependent dehydrogenase